LGLAVCGDPLYQADRKVGNKQTLDVSEQPLCLHAKRIEFTHPTTGERVSFEAPLPDWATAAELILA
jgi:23S rRNA-/tRNA-specific pseudouridylate synthase